MKKILCICLLAASMAGASAQSQEARENRAKVQRQRITPEMIAQNKTDKMSEALSLTKKQSKKLYKINLQEAQDQQQAMRPQRQRDERPQGERPQGQTRRFRAARQSPRETPTRRYESDPFARRTERTGRGPGKGDSENYRQRKVCTMAENSCRGED